MEPSLRKRDLDPFWETRRHSAGLLACGLRVRTEDGEPLRYRAMASGRISRSMLGQLKRFTWGHVIFLSALVGVVSGLGGIAFNYLVDKTDSVAMAQAAGF